jgi:hypothetical protein
MNTPYTALDPKDMDSRVQEIYSQLKFDTQCMKDERKSKEQAAKEVAIIKREIERLHKNRATLLEKLKKRGGNPDA